MQEVSGSIPLFSTKKALYFVGSMVLFFLLKADFWGLHCFACTVFRLLQAVELRPPRFRAIQQKRGIFVWAQHR